MKKFAYLTVVLVALFTLSGCDTLDIENIYDYNADLVWDDEKLVEAYLANVYASVFGNWAPALDQKTQQLSGIHFYPDRVTMTNSEYKLWDYTTIRLINEAIVNVENSALEQDFKDNITGQATFLRAYMYFNMVEGSLTLLFRRTKKPMTCTLHGIQPKHVLTLLRRIWRRPLSCCPKKLPTLPPTMEKSTAVLLLHSKPKCFCIKSGLGYALTENYYDIFLVERGPEVVFSVINTYPNKTASWDYGVRPGSESRGNASACPTWEFVQEFPMKDGRLYNDPDGKYYQTDDEFLQSYWENRDPRFDQSIVWNASVYEVSNKKGNRQYTSLGIADVLDDFGVNPAANINSTNLDRYSGFFIRKASDLSLLQSEVQQYDVDFIVMRFAEVMLNYAETANETGKTDEALAVLKAIRERAGIESGVDGTYGITAVSREEVREAILAERNIEFCFEGKFFWDLRRLRMLDRLDGKTKHGVEAIALKPDGSEMTISEARVLAENNELAENDFNYVVWQIPFTGVKVTSVPDKYYFFPIQQETIGLNNKIEQNKDWGGTFDPSL